MTHAELVDHLMARLHEVQERLGMDAADSPEEPFAEAVDSMGLVEFVGVIASDCGVKPAAIESAVARRFGTVADLARALAAARIEPREQVRQALFGFVQEQQAAASTPATALSYWVVWQPDIEEPSAELERRLGRPLGWLEQHAGIRSRWRWSDEEDPIERAAQAGQICLSERGVRRDSLAALLVTGEFPPRPVGLAAALHARLGLPAGTPALEVGGACLGWLHGVWLARRLVRRGADVLVIAVEAPSRWLAVEAGPAGEMAALFGDGAAAALLTAGDSPHRRRPLRDIVLGCDGSGGELVSVGLDAQRAVALRMDGPALALRAVHQLAEVVRQVCERNTVRVADLGAVYLHAGNSRMRPMVARSLGIPEEGVIATTEWSGNLGSVSLPAALSHQMRPGPVVLAAVGAGLCWGAALLDPAVQGTMSLGGPGC